MCACWSPQAPLYYRQYTLAPETAITASAYFSSVIFFCCSSYHQLFLPFHLFFPLLNLTALVLLYYFMYTCLTHSLKIPWLICLTGVLFHPSCTSLPCLQDIRPMCMPIMKHFDPNGYDLVKLQVVVLQITLTDLVFYRSNRDENVNCVK